MEPTRSQRILVVDDEPSIVDAVATSLRYEGFGVDEAVNGRLALAAAQQSPRISSSSTSCCPIWTASR